MEEQKKKSYIKILKVIIEALPIIAAIIYGVYTAIFAPRDLYEYMILSLLILLAFNSLNNIEFENAFNDYISKNPEKNTGVDVYNFENSDSCANMLNYKLSSDKQHYVDVVSLDQKTRTQKPSQKKHLVMNIINSSAENKKIRLRYIYSPRKGNFLRILHRIQRGYNNNSFFSYIDNQHTFPFASFIIIDNSLIMTRSPYEPSNTSEYYIIEGTKVVGLYRGWFNSLWTYSTELNSSRRFSDLLEKYKNLLSDSEFAEASRIIDSIDFREE